MILPVNMPGFPTGKLLWLEDGNVFVADADGQNKRDLNAPEGMSEIFGVSAPILPCCAAGMERISGGCICRMVPLMRCLKPNRTSNRFLIL